SQGENARRHRRPRAIGPDWRGCPPLPFGALIQLLSSIYGAAATWRRRRFARDPSRVRHLDRPVISVGNLRIGGAGKTPVVAYLARLFIEAGERPAILSRGYGRRRYADGVTIVSNGNQIVSRLDSAGDEPLMLARA